MRVPSLTLPTWAVDNEILDAIEAIVLSIHAELGSDEGIEKVLKELDIMREHINCGEPA